MSSVGERRRCGICNELVKVIALIRNGKGWYIQQLECGHTGRIRIMNSIEEKIEIKDEIKVTSIDHKYGQTYSRKTPKDSKINPCKTCGHRGTEHKFLSNESNNHPCYLCSCSEYSL